METPHTLQADIEPEELPEPTEPTDIRTVFQAGQFILMLLAACYFTGEIILPVILALVLNLVLQPVMRMLERLGVPQTLAALAIIAVLFGSAVGLGAALSGPAASWAQQMPERLPRVQERLTFLSKPIQPLQKFLHQAEDLAQGAGAPVATVAVQGGGLNERLLNATRTMASGLFTAVLGLVFLLVSRDTFLRRLVEGPPRCK